MANLIVHGGLGGSREAARVELVAARMPPEPGLTWNRTWLVHVLNQAKWTVLGWVGVVDGASALEPRVWYWIAADQHGRPSGLRRGRFDGAGLTEQEAKTQAAGLLTIAVEAW